MQLNFINILSGEKSEKLPGKIELNGVVIANPSLKECSVIGWRELPPTPKAEAGSVITSIDYVQDAKDPLRVEAVVTSKTDAQVAEEVATAEAAAQTIKDEHESTRQAARDEITKPFDKEQAEAIGKIFDMLPFLK